MPLQEEYIPAVAPARFEDDTAGAIAGLRDALRRWVGSLEGPPATATELQRVTRLDMKFCWKVFRLLDSPDALAAAMYVPGEANVRSLVGWIRRRGDDGGLADAVTSAHQRFEQIVAEHAGDRHCFETMVSPWTGEQQEKIAANHRRAAFRANRHIWGIQADAQLSCYIMCTSRENPDLLDGALLTSMAGIRRLRAHSGSGAGSSGGHSPLFSQLVGVCDDDGVIRRTLIGHPLDPENCGQLGLSIVRHFCSENLPHIITEQTSDGFVHATLPSEMIGLKSALTITTGHLTPTFAGRYQNEHNAKAHHTVFIQAPVKSLYLDVIVEDDTFGAIAPLAKVYADRTGRLPFPKGDQRVNVLSEREPVVRLGRGTRVLHTPHVAEGRYPALAEMALARLGVDAERCTAIRCRIDYPVMLSRVVMSFPLPER